MNRFYLDLVKKHGGAIRWVAHEIDNPFQKEEACVLAVKESGVSLREIPESLRSERVCLAAVSNPDDGFRALEFVPENRKSKEICLRAVDGNWRAMAWVPESLKVDDDIWRAAISQDFGGGEALGFLPEGHRTALRCREAVERSCSAFRWVPDEHKDEAMCKKVVSGNGWLLELVPVALRTPEVCAAAVKSVPQSLKYVPPSALTSAFYWSIAVSGMAESFVEAPDDGKSYEICVAAVEANPLSISGVPERLLNDELCRIALEGLPDVSDDFPSCPSVWACYWVSLFPWSVLGYDLLRRFIEKRGEECGNEIADYLLENGIEDPSLWEALAKRSGDAAIGAMPESLKTEKIFHIAFEEGKAKDISLVPDEFITEELCLMAVGNGPYPGLSNVPESFRSERVCLAAVKVDGMAVQYVPEINLTAEVCEAAILENPEAAYCIDTDGVSERAMLEAIRRDWEIVKCLPPRMERGRIYQRAIQLTEGGAFFAIPKEHLTRGLCRMAVTRVGEALREVPEEMRSRDICENAVAKSGWALGYVPKEFLSEKVCKMAVLSSPEILYGRSNFFDLIPPELLEKVFPQHFRSLREEPKEEAVVF